MDPNPIQLGVLIKRGELGIPKETGGCLCTDKRSHEDTERTYLQAKKRGLRRNLTCQHLDTRLLASKRVRK